MRRFQRSLSESIHATLKRATTNMMVYHILQARDHNFVAVKKNLNPVQLTGRTRYLPTKQEKLTSASKLSQANTNQMKGRAVEVVPNLPHETSEASDEASEASIDEWRDVRQFSSESAKRRTPYDSRDSSKLKRRQRIKSSRQPPKGVRRNVLTSFQRDILETWMKTHLDNPYPSKKEKIELSLEAGISERQVT